MEPQGTEFSSVAGSFRLMQALA